MHSNNFFRTLVLAACLLAVTAISNAQRSKPTTSNPAPAANPATVTAPAPKPATASTLTITTASLPDAEATRPYETTISVSGGKTPYGFAVSPDALSIDTATGKITYEPDSPGNVDVKVTVTDAEGKKVEKSFTLKVNAKKMTPSEIIEESKKGLATTEQLIQVRTRVTVLDDQEEGRVTKVEKAVNAHTDRLKAVINDVFYLKIFVGVALLIALLSMLASFGLHRRLKKANLSVAVTSLLALSMLTPFTFAAIKPIECGDPKFMGNFFEANGSAQDVVCKGIKGTAVTVSDAKVTVSDVSKDSAGNVTFKITPATDAAIDYLEVSVDGKSIGFPIEIVTAATFKERDRTIVSVEQSLKYKGLLGGGGSGSGSDDMRTLGFFNAVCGVDKDKARCGTEFGKGITGKELFSQLKKAKTQSEVDAVYSQLHNATQFQSADRTSQATMQVFLTEAGKKDSALNKVLQAPGEWALAESKKYTDSKVNSLADQIANAARTARSAQTTADSASTSARTANANIGNVCSVLGQVLQNQHQIANATVRTGSRVPFSKGKAVPLDQYAGEEAQKLFEQLSCK